MHRNDNRHESGDSRSIALGGDARDCNEKALIGWRDDDYNKEEIREADDEMSEEDGQDMYSHDYLISYEALSYVWGSPDDPKTISVSSTRKGSERRISVTRNLFIALRNMRLRTIRRVLLVDAICANQNDMSEKGRQVSLMGKIYSHAKAVTVWLGPEEDDSAAAFALIRDLGRHERNITGTFFGPIKWGERDLQAVYLLFARPWFERLRVRQEIYSAKNAMVQCGPDKMAWFTFKAAAKHIRMRPLRVSLLGESGGHFRRLQTLVYGLCHSNEAIETYENMRMSLRDVKWTNPKDTIYAMFNLLHVDDRELGIEPDYNADLGTIFKNVATRVINRHQSLGILSSCELHPNGVRSVTNLPSWVPDWATHLTIAHHIETVWNPGALISPQSEIYGDVLRASGILIAVVDEIYPLTLDVNALSRDTVIDHIRAIKPDVHIARTSTSGLDILEAYASALADSTSFAADDVAGYRIESLMNLDQAVAALHTIWSWDVVPEIDWETLSDLTIEPMEGDYIGRAPVATRPGDVLCVLLGADYPFILRRTQQLPVTPTVFTATQQSTSAKWQIVGPCKVPGLMAGEAIHGSLPRHYQPARRENYNMDTGWDIDVGLLDHRDGSFRRNPADILNEMGIRHLRYQQEPHQLEVEPKTLREAGVDLQDFYIV
ncbi:HET-domain-containing protein [Apiospora arundinis]